MVDGQSGRRLVSVQYPAVEERKPDLGLVPTQNQLMVVLTVKVITLKLWHAMNKDVQVTVFD